MMKKWLVLMMLCMVSAFSFATPKVDTTLAPVFTYQRGFLLTDFIAAAILTEFGRNNLRLSGTVGKEFSKHHRAKVTFEYLNQRLKFGYDTGELRRWMQQYALGVAYQYHLLSSWLAYLNASLYYANSPSRSAATTANPTARAAGAEAFGGDIGVLFFPWSGAQAELLANYDDVNYKTRIRNPVDKSGMGGTVRMMQDLNSHLALSAQAQFRKPFNFYELSLIWLQAQAQHTLNLVFFGRYTRTVDSAGIASAGVQLIFHPETGGRGLLPSRDRAEQTLKQWIARPAVMMPIVLAVADSFADWAPVLNLPGAIFIANCSPPRTWTVDLSTYVTDPAGLTFTFSPLSRPVSRQLNITNFDQTTGIITGNKPRCMSSIKSETIAVTVTNTAHFSATGIFTIIVG